MQLLQQALPQEEVEKSQELIDDKTTITSNGNVVQCKAENHTNKVHTNGSIDSSITTATVNGTSNHKHHNYKKSSEKENGYLHNLESNHHEIPNNSVLTKPTSKANNLNFNNLQSVKNTNTTSYQQIQNGIGSSIKELNVSTKCSPYKSKDDHNTYISSNACKKEYEKEKIIKDTNYEDTIEPLNQKRKEKHKDNQQYHQQHQLQITNSAPCEKAKVCEQCQKLEQEAKRLKSELQTLKNLEQEQKQKLENIKTSLQAKQKEHEEAQKQ